MWCVVCSKPPHADNQRWLLEETWRWLLRGVILISTTTSVLTPLTLRWTVHASPHCRTLFAGLQDPISQQPWLGGTACIVCTAGSMKWYGVRPSVCLSVRVSVPAWAHVRKPVTACLLLWARQAGYIDRLLRHRRTTAGSAMLSAYIVAKHWLANPCFSLFAVVVILCCGICCHL